MFRSLIRKLFFFLITCCLIWVSIFTFNQITDGFSLSQICSNLPPCPKFETFLTPEKKRELQTLLEQKFYYLGKGCQFYVFESEDGEYVIKFLKQKHLRSFSWLKNIPLPSKLRTYSDAKMERREERVNRLFSSCKLAYDQLAEETGLIFIHLNRTPAIEKKVTLIDKIGFKHTILIDEYEYFVQRKGISLKEIFSYISEEEVPKRVQQIADLILSRCSKGISDKDPAFVQNVAFLGDSDRAIFTDFGQFYEDPTSILAEAQMQDLKQRINSLRAWAESNFPEFAKLVFQVL